MKKLVYLFFILLSVFCMTGCKDEDTAKENDPIEDPIYTSYKNELYDYINELIPDTYNKRMTLPTEYEYTDGMYAIIEWDTSNKLSITNNGNYLVNAVDNNVTLTADVTIDGYDDFLISKTVLCIGKMTPTEYIDEFNKLYLPEIIYQDIELTNIEDKILYDSRLEGTITYQSTDETILSNDGKYVVTSPDDCQLLMNYTINIRGIEIKGSKEIRVLGRNDIKRIEDGINWLENKWLTNDFIIEDIELPLTDETGIVNFEWESNDKTFIDDNGKFIRGYEVGKEIVFSVKVMMNDVVDTEEIKFKTLPKEKMVEYVLNRMNKSQVYQSYFTTYVVTGGYKNIDYGYLNFYSQDVSEADLILNESTRDVYTYGKNVNNINTTKKTVNSLITHLDYKRPGTIKKSTDFICVHDTGDNKFSAAEWANEVLTSEREVSWHFTVDDKDIYQQIPLNEVAWHAGDGSNTFGLRDTGIKYTVKNPELIFKEDGYLYINGEKSNCLAPIADNKYQTAITNAWLYTELGENGNYYINNYYYNASYKKISNGGGNRNSVGIETCILDGVKYSKVMRTTANLVAHLLNLYNLDTTRVMQHRNFSGKHCPYSMIEAPENSEFTWNAFMDLVEIEYFIIKNMPDVKMTYTSNNPDILDNNGNILKYVSEKTEVSYNVKVELNSQVYNYTYKTIINPIA